MQKSTTYTDMLFYFYTTKKMKKFLITVIILLALVVAANRWYKHYGQSMGMDTQMTGDVATQNGDTQTTTTDDVSWQSNTTIDATNTQKAVDNASGDVSTVVDAEFKAKLEQQQNIVLSGDKVTEDDIKLIEDILKQITDGTGTK